MPAPAICEIKRRSIERRRSRWAARYIATVIYGIAVQAAGGASREQLQHVVEMTLRTLPL
jgi:hypothetical protein